MATLEDRVTIVEVQTDKLAAAVEDVRKEVAAIRNEMATRTDLAVLRTELRGEIAELRTDVRANISDLRADMREPSRRTDRLFIWVAGAQVATLLAVVGVLAGALFR